MASTEKQKLLANIRHVAKTLYLLDPKEMGLLLENMEYFPEEALLQSLELLTQAKEKQDEVLKKLATKDPHVNKNLKNFLRKEYQTQTSAAGLAEGQTADNILNKL